VENSIPISHYKLNEGSNTIGRNKEKCEIFIDLSDICEQHMKI
jgi:hypothetical protein